MAAANWKKKWLATFSMIHGIMLMAGMKRFLFNDMLNCYHYCLAVTQLSLKALFLRKLN